jgi:cation transport ATPase
VNVALKESRVEKHRSQRKVDSDVTRFWVLGSLFVLLVLAFEFYIEIPEQAQWLQELEMALFSASFTLLAFYLLGLTFVFSRQEQAGKINYHVIIYSWLGAILFHLFLLINSNVNTHIYTAGIILFLGPLFLTVFHFITYLSALREARREARLATEASYERTVYQLVLEGTKTYNEIKRLKELYPEVEQMLRANDFYIKMERFILEMQQYLQASRFGRKDVELLEGHYLFLENLLIQAKQYPEVRESRSFRHREEWEDH